MNFGQLQAYTLSLLDDLQGTYFTPVQLNQWLNNAQKETQKLLVLAGNNRYLKCVITPLITNQRDYLLPADFLHLHRLDIILTGSPPMETATPMSEITLNQQDLVIGQTGQPQWYYYKQNRITLLPAPSMGSNSPTIPPTLRLYYSYEVADMELPTDQPDIPDYYHEFLGILAAIDGYLKDGRDPTPLIAKREYYEKMLKADTTDRSMDSPRTIVMTDAAYNGTIYW